MLRVRHRGPSPEVRRNRRIATVVVIVLLAALIVGAFLLFAPRSGGEAMPAPSTTPSPSRPPSPEPEPTPTFDMSLYSIDDPTSLWVVVNKRRPLQPQDYVPPDLVDVPVEYVYSPQLRAEASAKVVEMFAAYQAETGRQMQSQSAYRSYGTQVDVYNGWVSSLGQEAADLTSARPGHSEHQTGLAIDISSVPAVCAVEMCFRDTPEAAWLAANSWKYGFIVRYPEGKTEITGYEYEPYHFRYVGIELATQMHDTGIQTLEEFFGLPAAPNYG